MNIVLMSDPKGAAVPVRECGKDLVDVRAHGIRADARRQDETGAFAHVRRELLERLLHAQSLLPGGLRLLFIERYRSPALQRRYFEEYSAELARAHAGWPPSRIRGVASRYVSPPEIAPHSELDMGARVNASPEEWRGACYTHAPNLDP